MNIYSLPALSVFFVSIILGFYIFNKDTKAKFNRSFLLLTLTVSLWVLGKFMKRADIGLSSPELWSMVEMTGAILVAPLMLYFISLFQPATNPSILKKTQFWLVIYLICGVFLFLLYTGNLISEIVYGQLGPDFSVGYAYILFDAYFLVILFLSMARIFNIFKISRKRDVVREQSKIVFLGLLVAGLFIGANDVIFPIVNFEIIPLTGFGLLFFEILIVYTVSKHRLLVIPQMRRFFSPTPEAFLKTKEKYKIEKYHNYLFREKEPNRSADLFVNQVTHGNVGLWITTPNQKSPQRIGIRKTPILLLTEEVVSGIASHPIDKLDSLIILVENEISLIGGKTLVMFDCFEDIVIVNTFKKSLDFISKLSRVCFRHSSNLIVRADPKKFTKKQLIMLEKCLSPVRVDIATIL